MGWFTKDKDETPKRPCNHYTKAGRLKEKHGGKPDHAWGHRKDKEDGDEGTSLWRRYK